MTAPFEGVFGDTSELRVIQFLLPLKSLEFNISELDRGTGISRQTMVSVMRKLAKWNVLKLTSTHGNANYYAIIVNNQTYYTNHILQESVLSNT